MYFAAGADPVGRAVTLLNGDGPAGGPVNNLAVMSTVAPSYAPPGRHLIGVTVLGGGPQSDLSTGIAGVSSDPHLEAAVRMQLSGWFGSDVRSWEHLRTYDIGHAQPALMSCSPPEREQLVADGLYVAGDHRDHASIQGALRSGQRVAEALLATL